MSELLIILPNGASITFLQLVRVDSLIAGREDECHWHPNRCGCCLTLHTPDGDYVIGEDGNYDFFPVT